ncbi:MAG: SRPBCC family protein, partial [Saccharomonospora viridis]
MSELVASVEVAAPVGTTWLALTDWERQREWIPATTVRVVSGNGRSVGSRLEAFTGVGGIGVTDTMEIVNWEPPVRCTVRHL